MQQQQQRRRYSALELVGVLLGLLYSCVIAWYFLSYEGNLLGAGALLLLLLLPALTILFRVRRVAIALQWLTAFFWGLLSLYGLGVTAYCFKKGNDVEYFWIPLVAGLGAAAFMALHLLIARHLRDQDG
jgi:hypothetical protein